MDNWKDRLVLLQGDIADEDCDIIVNAANEDLTPGGGVCGAIHLAAGPGLEAECADVGGCPTGEAALTGAHDLGCQYIIHAVGPIYGGGAGSEEEDLLASCYRESMRLCDEAECSTIAFPCISTGSYGYPKDKACRVALAAVRDALDEYPDIDEVRLVCWTAADLVEYERALAEME